MMPYKKHRKPGLLIIDKTQYGYVTDTYNWCLELRDRYTITVITADEGNRRIETQGVKVIYVPFVGICFLLRGVLFITTCLLQIFKQRKRTIIVEHFKGCSILPCLCGKKNMIMDVRTLSIDSDKDIRNRFDNRIRRDGSKFEKVTVISQGVKDKLGLNNTFILPLGYKVSPSRPKNYKEEMNILYVGTLGHRNIHEMIEGIGMFHKKHPEESLTIDIVGDGIGGDFSKLECCAKKWGLDKYIRFHGFIHTSLLSPFFDKCNVGITYVPLTEYYDHQPPTKTYEYIGAGLFCIATGTQANKDIIRESNGIVIQDNPESLCEGLEQFIRKRESVDEKNLRDSVSSNSWQNIVNHILFPLLKNNTAEN
ncbi:MAG: glycosyltransferase [Paramuribaculum sp.]|nr:glycosyltransferase [Paramuribaculum sp.]